MLGDVIWYSRVFGNKMSCYCRINRLHHYVACGIQFPYSVGFGQNLHLCGFKKSKILWDEISTDQSVGIYIPSLQIKVGNGKSPLNGGFRWFVALKIIHKWRMGMSWDLLGCLIPGSGACERCSKSLYHSISHPGWLIEIPRSWIIIPNILGRG